MAVYTILSSHSFGEGFIREKEGGEIKRSDFPGGFLFGVATSAYQVAYVMETMGIRILVKTAIIVIWKTLRYCILLGWMHTDSQFHGPEFCLSKKRNYRDQMKLNIRLVPKFQPKVCGKKPKMDVNNTHICFLFFFLLCLLLSADGFIREKEEEEIKRSDFPAGFLFGAATSAYQIEGAYLEDGKGLSNWDVFCRINGSIQNGADGDICDDHFHRYMEDIEILHSLGVDAYRFSISWARILPRGRFGEINPKGIMFYIKIIDYLLLKGIEPFVTIHHRDLPQELEDRYGAWLSPLMNLNGGVMGTVIHMFMYEPLTDDKLDQEAATRALAFNVAWGLDPLIFGDYPLEMRHYLGSELPQFSLEETKCITDSIDFIGVNHYSSLYAKDCTHSSCLLGGDHAVKGFVYTTGERDGVPIGGRTGMDRFFIVPKGMEKIINYVKKRYHNMPMYVTENGYPAPQHQGLQDILQDVKRIEFHKAYLASLAQAIRNGADVRGYFVWTLMDDFEWVNGYNIRLGLYYVDP